ncbi:MAG: TonB-dependent receptor, partial [Thermoanaerobaculia bacterium]
MDKSRLRIPLLILILLLVGTSLLAADGRIAGRVTRSNGSPIGGVVVQALGTSRAAITDRNGNYVLDAIPPGTYTLNFSAAEHVANEEGVVVGSGATTQSDKSVDWRISIAETITVTSASRASERLVDAPAAVTVVRHEEIQAAAPTGQAPRVLENAPGVDFTQSGLYDFNFNTRGFNTTLNRRILTLIDGRDPSVPFLGAQEWAALSFPIDEFSNIELVRGPGSALYGANAYSGVLNMTTRLPRGSEGGRLLLTGGDLSTFRGDIRHAGALGNEWYYRVVGGYQQSDDYTRSRNAGVEYGSNAAGCAAGTVNCLPREAVPLRLNDVQTAFGGIRFDKHMGASLLTVEGGLAHLEGPTFQTGIGRVQTTDVDHPWGRVNLNMLHWNFLAYYDGRLAEDQVALASGAGLWEDSSNIHGEIQTNWDFFSGRTRLVGGVAYNTQDVSTKNDQGFHTLMAEDKSEDSQSAFGQMNFDITQNFKVVLAARYDESDLYEAQFSPKGAIVYSFTPHHSIRYGYNEAFQRPNYSELFLRAPAGAPANLAAAAAANPAAAPLAPALTALGFNSMAILARGNSALDVEKVKSHEIGYQGIFGGKLYITADYYQSKLSDFVTDLLPGVNPAFAPYVVPSSLPAPVQAGINGFLRAALGARFSGLTTVNGRPALVLSYSNAGKVDTQGVELAFNYYLTNNWLVDANYTWFDFEVKQSQLGDVLLPNVPENKYNVGLAYIGSSFDARLAWRNVEEFSWAAGVFNGFVPAYDVANLSARYRFNDRIGVGVEVSNAFDNEHWESFGGDIMQRRGLAFVS